MIDPFTVSTESLNPERWLFSLYILRTYFLKIMCRAGLGLASPLYGYNHPPTRCMITSPVMQGWAFRSLSPQPESRNGSFSGAFLPSQALEPRTTVLSHSDQCLPEKRMLVGAMLGFITLINACSLK